MKKLCECEYRINGVCALVGRLCFEAGICGLFMWVKEWEHKAKHNGNNSMKWVRIKGSTYKCPNCGTRFIIRKKWVCCPVCGKKLSGVKEQK